MNKKGQEGFTLTQFLSALFFFALVVLIGYFAYSYYTGAAQYLPSDLQNLALACDGYATGGLSVAYCDFHPISFGSSTAYVNCDFSKVKAYVKDKTLAGSCTQAQNDAKCAELRTSPNFVNGSMINEFVCK